MAATILPAPREAPAPRVTLTRDGTGMSRVSIHRSTALAGATAFLRVALPGDMRTERVFIALPVDGDRAATMPLSADPNATLIRLERLITNGT